jgi:stearoyl-CoA desaturase (delta-9 desaturase)
VATLGTSSQEVQWSNISFFSITTFLAVVGTPLYISRSGIEISEILLFAFYVFATSLSITVGYHRLFAHAAFKANAIVRFILLFFGAAAFQESALKWTSQHRDHHRYVDTDQDPYSIKKGFFYAHLGWMIFWEHPFHFENARDLQKSRLLMHQHRYYMVWSIAAGILTPVFIGALTGHMMGAFLLAVCARITIVHHGTWCINSVCHLFGKSTYDIYSSAKDHWFAALITNGEGYHNYHHHFPGDYRNGVRWYQWDSTKWIIAVLAQLGLAWDLKRVSAFRILAARLAAEKKRNEDRLLERMEHPNTTTHWERIQTQYERLKQTLGDWEHSARNYEEVLRQHIARHEDSRRRAAVENLEARRRFQAMLAEWKCIIHSKPQSTRSFIPPKSGPGPYNPLPPKRLG